MKSKGVRRSLAGNLTNPRTVRRLISVGLVLIMAVIFSATTDAFLSFRNLMNMLKDSAFLGLFALGMSFVIIGGGIDLSVGGIACVVGVLTVRMTVWGIPGILVVLLAIFLGAIFGSINALLITRARLTEFVTTLATGFVFTGLTLVFSFRERGLVTLVEIPRKSDFRAFGGNISGVHYITIVWIALTVILYFVLIKTRFGLHTYAIGSHAKSAQMSGVNNARVKTIGYLISGACAGLAVALQAALNGSSALNIGSSYEFKAIAACVVGGVVLGGGKGDAINALIGSLFFLMLMNGLYKYGLPFYWDYILQGVVILVVTAFDALFNMATSKRLLARS